jgi:hypothetical protein
VNAAVQSEAMSIKQNDRELVRAGRDAQDQPNRPHTRWSPSPGFQVKQTMVTVFFTATRLIVWNSLPQGQSFSQDYFMSEIIPAFAKEKLRFRRHHPGVTFSVNINNFRCHTGRMATTEFDQ